MPREQCKRASGNYPYTLVTLPPPPLYPTPYTHTPLLPYPTTPLTYP